MTIDQRIGRIFSSFLNQLIFNKINVVIKSKKFFILFHL